MSFLAKGVAKMGILKPNLDHHIIRVSMAAIFFLLGYANWCEYEVHEIIPFARHGLLVTHGPLIMWMYPVFGIRGSTCFLGVSEWAFGALLFAGFWNKQLGMFGALGSLATFITAVTIIPFMPDAWVASAGGFNVMTGNIAFLMKDVVLLAVSFYLLKQDTARLASAASLDELAKSASPNARPSLIQVKKRA